MLRGDAHITAGQRLLCCVQQLLLGGCGRGSPSNPSTTPNHNQVTLISTYSSSSSSGYRCYPSSRMRPDVMFEGSEEHGATPFATPDTLASCAQYLEPILRGVPCVHGASSAGLLAGWLGWLHTARNQSHSQAHESAPSRQAGVLPLVVDAHATMCLCCPIVWCCLADVGLRQWQLQGGDAVAAVNRLFDLVQQFQHLQDARELEQDDLHKAKVGLRVLGAASSHVMHHVLSLLVGVPD